MSISPMIRAATIMNSFDIYSDPRKEDAVPHHKSINVL